MKESIASLAKPIEELDAMMVLNSMTNGMIDISSSLSLRMTTLQSNKALLLEAIHSASLIRFTLSRSLSVYNVLVSK